MESHRSQVPSALLVQHLSRLPKGKALDIATGFGRNGLYLAEQGYEVDGLDRDVEGIGFANAEAKRRSLSYTGTAVDLEKEKALSAAGHPGRYDLLLCFYYLDRKLIPRMKEAVRIGGVVVYETFLIDQHERFGKPGRREFCWERNELLRSFLDFRILYYFEGLLEGTWTAQLIAERVEEAGALYGNV